MKFPLYAVRDSLVGFGMPIIRDNDAVASRSFEYDFNRDDSPYRVHSEEYSLFHIGEYDTDTGDISPLPPRLVVCASDFSIKE